MTTETKRFPRAAIIPAAALAVYLIFFVRLGSWLWAREHYQFFPVVLIASAALAWWRFSDITRDHSPRITFRVAVYGSVALFLLLIAAVLGSNLIGSVSGIVMLWTLIWYYGGPSAAKALRGPVFMLLLIMPLPLNLDLQLIIGLQKIASAAASQMLDLQYIRHQLSGVAITTIQKSFMVEEACSGIHSLYSCLCVVVFVSVVERSGFFRILVNVAQTVFWVIVANAIRVFLIVYSFTIWDVSLTTGWQHEALGVGTYVFALLFALSTDKLLQFLVPVRPGNTELSESPIKRMNVLLDRVVMTRARSFVATVAVLALVFFPLAAIQYGQAISSVFAAAPATETGPVSPNFTKSIDGLLSSESVMPASFNDWELTETERVNRNPDDPLGTNSTLFTYSGGGLTAHFSIDGYYPAWHDLAYCYVSLGWEVGSQRNTTDQVLGHHQTELSIYTEDGQHAQIYFSCFDSNTQSVTPDDPTIGVIPTISTLMERTGWSDGQRDLTPMVPPVFQLQLMCPDNRELLQHEKDSLRRLFRELNTQALKTLEVTE